MIKIIILSALFSFPLLASAHNGRKCIKESCDSTFDKYGGITNFMKCYQETIVCIDKKIIKKEMDMVEASNSFNYYYNHITDSLNQYSLKIKMKNANVSSNPNSIYLRMGFVKSFILDMKKISKVLKVSEVKKMNESMISVSNSSLDLFEKALKVPN